MSDLTVPPPSEGPLQAAPFMTTQEAYIHALVGAPFGDLELDVGKSIRWTQWFTDDVFITDINTGDPRYWIVNWDLTFPNTHHHVTGVNYFVDPVGFRKEQFAHAQKEPGILLEDSDWVLFVDAAEGMSCDSRSLPDDYLIQPFRSYVYREITRAVTAGRDNVVLPFFAFLRHANIVTVDYRDQSTQGLGEGHESIQQSLGTPYYVANQGLARLWKVSALRAPNFDWTKIDQPQAVPDPTVKIQLVSYAYAHWNLQDIVPPDTDVPPLDANNDDGWRMRKLISKVRPIPSLPYTDPWKPPSADTPGIRGPWAGQMTGAPVVGQLNPATFNASAGDYVRADNLDLRILTQQHTWHLAVIPNSVAASTTLVTWTAHTLPDPTVAWKIGVEFGNLLFTYVNTDGASVTVNLGVAPWSVGLTSYIGVDVSLNGPLYEVAGITSDNGQNWFEFGTPQTFEPKLLDPVLGQVEVFTSFNGTALWAEQDISNTQVWRFSPADYRYDISPRPTSWDDPRDLTWTVYSDQTKFIDSTITPFSITAPDPAAAGVLVPLYDAVFRINLRDGVWYDAGQVGNVPMIWDNSAGKWVPVVHPPDWHDTDSYVASVQ